jgi:hypothetical protein
MTTNLPTYEKLGAFYLGRVRDLDRTETAPEGATGAALLYDAKDLTTHAMCVGMTGSGKTGLCLSLLEEAGIDGIPAIAIDPKGDIGNLLLTFPRLLAEDFRPWIDEAEAQRKGMTADEYAKDRAESWRRGLADWDQDGARIERFRRAVDLAIYTPGSTAGRRLRALRSFAAPPSAVRGDGDLLRERVNASVSGLLALLGLDADPIRSREHVLLSAIIDGAWRAERDLELADLVAAVQSPPFDRVGVMHVDSFFPAKERAGLAMALNGILASPGFAAWTEGEPLDAGHLLYTADGRPRISVVSIAHLSDAERMFFVTLLLNEVVTWMRTRPGTGSLRAILFMDEIFGFFPPTANPPAKTPMLTLLKQARAYGLGIVLATQNPVDLDYKGLANAGTWFIGRLQTQRDKERLVDGLAGTAGAGIDRGLLESMLGRLRSRMFLMSNVHDDAPVVFETRWALSYLRGPLTRAEIERLAAPAPGAARDVPPRATPAPEGAPIPALVAAPAAAPAGVDVRFLAAAALPRVGERIVYRPAILATGALHYVRASARVDEWRDVALVAPLDEATGSDPWPAAIELVSASAVTNAPLAGASFAPLSPIAARPGQFAVWADSFAGHVYRHRPLTIWSCAALDERSEPGEDEGAFRVRLRQRQREARDLAVEKLRQRYAPKVAAIRERIRKAQQRVDVEKAQYRAQGVSTAVSFGTAVLGALFGRKLASAGSVARAGTALRSAGRAAQQRGDIGRAEESVEALEAQLQALEAQLGKEVEALGAIAGDAPLELETIVVPMRKSDARCATLLAWLPYRIDAAGAWAPLFTAREGPALTPSSSTGR